MRDGGGNAALALAIGYIAAALIALLVAFRESGNRRRPPSPSPAAPRGSRAARYPAIWYLLALTLWLLAMQKGSGVLGRVTEVARQEARTEGWYGERREFQKMVVAAIPPVCVVLLAGGAFLVRRAFARYLPALGALLFLVGYAAIQAVSLHQIDALLRQRYGPFLLRTWGDLLGLALAAGAAIFTLTSEIRAASRSET